MSIMKETYIRDLLFVLYALYFSQGALYAQGTSISQFALASIFIISVFYFFKILFQNNKKPLFYKVVTILLFLNLIAFVWSGFFKLEMFKRILICLLPIYPFYYFTTQGEFKAKHLIRFFLLILPVVILQYFFNKNQSLQEQLGDSENVVNNIAYTFVKLTPFVFLLKTKKVWSILLMLILMFFIIQGAKRGAIFAGAFSLLIFTYYQLRTVSKK